MKYKLKMQEIKAFNQRNSPSFPKYTTQLMNLANGNAKGTAPLVVGQMSELFPEFVISTEEMTIENWKKWYTKKNPDAVQKATEKILNQIENLRKALEKIDEKLIREWVEDLIISKTFNGLYVQEVILRSVAEKKGMDFRLAEPEEEARGIDGFVGEIAYSIKPDTYKTMGHLPENIECKKIFYTKRKDGLDLDIEV